MIENKKAKRIWFITDTHLGIKNSSNEWIEIMQSYFKDWFFPLIRKEYKDGDILVHLGDWYDSRQSLSLKALNLGVWVAEEMSSIFKDGIYVIAGNHDVWGKNSNEINSLKSIKWIPNFTILEEPESAIFGNRSVFMMPWRKNPEQETETLNIIEPHDYLFCHTDIVGLKFNKYSNVEHGTKEEELEKFRRIYSGHIHYSQNKGNVRMLGSPYELTRSDMGNRKYIMCLDLKTEKEKTHTNDFSPRYKKFIFEYLLNRTPEQLEPEFRNNFVDIYIDPSLALKAQLGLISDIISSHRSLNFHPYSSNETTQSNIISDSDGQFNVMSFIKDYINTIPGEDETTKDKLYRSMIKLYQRVSNEEIEGN